jgi:hypothetical protein
MSRGRFHQRRSLDVIRIAHGEEKHDLPSTSKCGIDAFGVFPLEVPLASDGGNGAISVGGGSDYVKEGIFGFKDWRGFASSRGSSLCIVCCRAYC